MEEEVRSVAGGAREESGEGGEMRAVLFLEGGGGGEWIGCFSVGGDGAISAVDENKRDPTVVRRPVGEEAPHFVSLLSNLLRYSTY